MLLTAFLVIQAGLEFLGVLILIGIAAGMTFGILSYGGNGREELEIELSELREKMKTLDAKVEDIGRRIKA